MLDIEMHDGLPEIRPDVLALAMRGDAWKSGGVRLIDVRGAEEFVGELGHIDGAELVTLGPELQSFIDNGDPTQEIVFVCRSGGRSGQATAYAVGKGYSKVANMSGGMLRWNELGHPVQK